MPLTEKSKQNGVPFELNCWTNLIFRREPWPVPRLLVHDRRHEVVGGHEVVAGQDTQKLALKIEIASQRSSSRKISFYIQIIYK